MTGKDALKAGLWTALFTFVAAFSVTALGWLQAVGNWASSNGASEFPALSVLGYGAAAALVAVVSGLVNALVRFGQAKGVIPGAGPIYVTTSRTAPPGIAQGPFDDGESVQRREGDA